MALCNLDGCSEDVTTVVVEANVTGDGRRLEVAGGVYCDGHRPSCVTGPQSGAGVVWNGGKHRAIKPIGNKSLAFDMKH